MELWCNISETIRASIFKIDVIVTETISEKLHYKTILTCEISSSHGGEYDVQSCLLGYTAV
jgi:hypothetical protein